MEENKDSRENKIAALIDWGYKQQTHVLKTWPEYYQAVASGRKTFEARKNDRNYLSGDFLVLQEWNPKTLKYTGEECICRIGFILYGPDFGIQDGHCVMSLIKTYQSPVAQLFDSHDPNPPK